MQLYRRFSEVIRKSITHILLQGDKIRLPEKPPKKLLGQALRVFGRKSRLGSIFGYSGSAMKSLRKLLLIALGLALAVGIAWRLASRRRQLPCPGWASCWRTRSRKGLGKTEISWHLPLILSNRDKTVLSGSAGDCQFPRAPVSVCAAYSPGHPGPV
jgi:hypothetical protein